MAPSVSARCIVLGLNIALLCTMSGCASGGATGNLIGVTPELEREQSAPKPDAAESESPAETVVEDAALPFRGFRAADGEDLTSEELLTYLASANAICIGEKHDEELHHYAQLAVIRGLIERQPMRGFELGVGLEMVRAENQPLLTAYASGRLTEEQFEVESNWKTEWGFPIQFYRPQLTAAKNASARLLGLGVNRELTRKIARLGIEGLSGDERTALPELDKSSVDHRKLFEEMMSDHPHGEDEASPQGNESYYEAQLTWDETMAKKSRQWLTAKYPLRKLVILAGAAHCHRSAIPTRVERDSEIKVVNLIAVMGSPLDPSATDGVQKHMAEGYDFQMVFEK